MKRKSSFLFILNEISLIIAINPIIQLPNGAILGKGYKTLQGTSYYAFEKIPYAKPPIGALRFMPPEPPERWNGTLNCTRLDIMCYQIIKPTFPQSEDSSESEDCLFINVFTPELLQNSSIPVMFFVHGGGFTEGNSESFRPDFFMDHDVILVTFNYRLGAFGFLSTEDHVIRGNMGLKDQHLALKWVQTNIKFFGGDPSKVTLYGHSAGAAAVCYHLLNPSSEGLFWAAISQSGSCLGAWAYQMEARKIAYTMVSLFNSTINSNTTSEDLLRFLQGLEAWEIVNAEKLYNLYFFKDRDEDMAYLTGRYFVPTLEVNEEGAFLTEGMYGLLKKGKFLKVPLMIGIVSEENLHYHLVQTELEATSKLYDSHVEYLVPSDLQTENKTETGLLIKKMYTNGKPFIQNLGATIKFSSDNDMVRPIMKEAELHSKQAPTYFYLFSHDGPVGSYGITYEGADNVGHFADVKYLFYIQSETQSDITEPDQTTRNRMLKLWTNFAKFKNPTPVKSDLLQNLTWPLLTVDEEHFPYVNIGSNLEVKNFPRKEQYKKWMQLYNLMNKHDMYTL